MPDRQIPLDDCPLCDLDPSLAIETTRGSKLTTQNAVSAGTVRTCVSPRVMQVEDEKRAGILIVFHKEEDAEFVTAADLAEDTSDEEGEGTTGDEQEETTTVSDLPQFERAIFERVRSDEPVELAGIQGAATAATGKSLEEVEAAVDWLKEQGYIVETEAETYEVT